MAGIGQFVTWNGMVTTLISRAAVLYPSLPELMGQLRIVYVLAKHCMTVLQFLHTLEVDSYFKLMDRFISYDVQPEKVD